jgi:penicillin V acylase-like amidase (Ntn superfamily)
MDWVENPGSEIWLFPRDMKCHGNAGPEILEWTSVHGSVGVSSSTRSRRTSPARRPSPRCSA